jgi:hypothetical protein
LRCPTQARVEFPSPLSVRGRAVCHRDVSETQPRAL